MPFARTRMPFKLLFSFSVLATEWIINSRGWHYTDCTKHITEVIAFYVILAGNFIQLFSSSVFLNSLNFFIRYLALTNCRQSYSEMGLGGGRPKPNIPILEMQKWTNFKFFASIKEPSRPISNLLWSFKLKTHSLCSHLTSHNFFLA